MKDISWYEQVALIVPGSLLLFGLLIMEPGLQSLFVNPSMTVGGLALFLVIAYAVGHLVAACGNLLEALVWAPVGGMPSNWIRHRRPRILHENEFVGLAGKLASRHQRSAPDLLELSSQEWKAAFHLIYRDVLSSGSYGRVDVFNGNYGMSRGMAVACLLLAIVVVVRQPPDWISWMLASLGAGALFIVRMVRFGMHFAREVFYRFMLLPDQRT